MSPRDKRRPVLGAKVSADQVPRRKVAPAPPPAGTLVVQFGRFDVDGPWCLSKITPEDHRNLLTRIGEIETMTVQQVFGTGNTGTDYEVAKMPTPVALRRLTELDIEDQERICQLRITKQQRLFGIRHDERFYALWWDPLHEIWPTNK